MSLPPKKYNYWSGADDQSLFDPHRLPFFTNPAHSANKIPPHTSFFPPFVSH